MAGYTPESTSGGTSPRWAAPAKDT